MTEDSRFDIASTGKTFTATCVPFPIHEGKIDPDAPFTDYLPDHPMAHENHTITVRDLAMHISGFDNSRSHTWPADGPHSSRNSTPKDPSDQTRTALQGRQKILGILAQNQRQA